ncbi:hypothetical protein LSCM1_04138 [Leishmania martiniquensis]|uniref:Uncharacterized protein n=1 Tax=Leishmania martiniquensis TaxID=1580590 RepID=A0A836H7H8_9TRYP|nr:hypothetical protein LSCM1_04138 [Leishmania martiniquensis]
MKCSATLYRVPSAFAAAAPRSHRNAPHTREDRAAITRELMCFKSNLVNLDNRNLCCGGGDRFGNFLGTPPALPLAPAFRVTAANGSTFIDSSSSTIATRFNDNSQIKSFRQCVCAATDVSMRPLLLLLDDARALRTVSTTAGTIRPAATAAAAATTRGRSKYSELLEQLSCRWAAKFYGKVTYGPRNYPYPSSRWLARRFQMKKHRILKRFRFRRYKLAAVANLPFAKMIRVGMLPELKSSKTKKGDAVDIGLSSQLVSAARSSAGATKTKDRRTRPKSKYQL